MNQIYVVCPIYNDWISFQKLIKELDKVAGTLPAKLSVIGVNDGSTYHWQSVDMATPVHLGSVEIIHLSLNLGHQRAIAVGLCVTVQDGNADAVVIMDADGEDPPESIIELVLAANGQRDFCIVAKRRRRQESVAFKLNYFLYKMAFRAVTGHTINFGNFSFFSYSYLKRLTMVPDLWNNIPAAILRSRLPFVSIPIDRGMRYAGKSQMNTTSLIIHGMSGISVYAETIFVRLFILSLILMVLCVFLVSFVLVLRVFFPSHATPGWATTVAFGMVIIVLQVLFTALSSVLMLLNNRVQRLIIPIVDFMQYIASRELIFRSQAEDR